MAYSALPRNNPQHNEISLEEYSHTNAAGSIPNSSVLPRDDEQSHLVIKHSGHGDPSYTVSRRSDATMTYQRPAKRNIHWQSPTTMLISLVLGIGLASGHHSYYRWLDGQDVGDTEKQQWSLRFGNAFAISIALCFKTAVGIAYIQLLWLTLRRQHMTLGTINDGFDISGNFLAFFNFELLRKVKAGVLIAVILWSLPIPTLFAPATLSVGSQTTHSIDTHQALNIDINNASLQDAFAWRASADVPQITGPSARLRRLVSAVAAGGSHLPFTLPSARSNTSYELEAFLPLLRCEDANTTVQDELSGLIVQSRFADNGTVAEGSMKFSYHNIFWEGEVGFLGTSRPYATVDRGVSNQTQLAWNVTNEYSNEFAFAIQQKPTDSKTESDTAFITCGLWNASVAFTVRTLNGIADIENVRKTWIRKCDPYPRTSEQPAAVTSFAAYFMALSSNLLGYIYWQHNNVRTSLFAQGSILESYLSLGSQFFDMMDNMANVSAMSSILQNAEAVRNVSFSEDVEAFSLNVSLSMLNDPSLCKHVPVDVTSTTVHTVYAYHARNLLISYGLAILFSALSVCLGAYAFWANGVSYDAKVSSIGTAMHNSDVKEALEQSHTNTAQPLSMGARKIMLRFDPDNGFLLKSHKQ